MAAELSPRDDNERKTTLDERVSERFVRRVTSLPDGRRLTLYARPAAGAEPSRDR